MVRNMSYKFIIQQFHLGILVTIITRHYKCEDVNVLCYIFKNIDVKLFKLIMIKIYIICIVGIVV